MLRVTLIFLNAGGLADHAGVGVPVVGERDHPEPPSSQRMATVNRQTRRGTGHWNASTESRPTSGSS
jgi:hypothetical protein